MKAVVAGYGSTGDTLPLIALAAGLRDAGHEVVLLADEAAGTTARRLGLALSAAYRAPGSISSARLTLTSRESPFMRARSARVTQPRVASPRRRCRERISAWRKKLSLSGALAWPSCSACRREASLPHTSTDMPKARP